MVSSELRDAVIWRDAKYLWEKDGWITGVTLGRPHSFAAWLSMQKRICLVRLLDPDNPYPCEGKQEVDHVKDQPMMGKRAPDDEWHLVAMCQNHNTWHPPRKQLRQAERAYLARARAARELEMAEERLAEATSP